MVNKKLHILHIITTLSLGGAEMMLYKLLQKLNRLQYESSVLSLSGQGEIGLRIEKLNIRVFTLNLKNINKLPVNLFRLVMIIKKINPQIIQTWLYHSDLLSSLTVFQKRKHKIVWNIRHSNLNSSVDKLTTRTVAKLCAFLSHFIPDRIICNSTLGSDVHTGLGYDANKIQIIANGFDTEKFIPNDNCYTSLRKELNISMNSIIIGMVARMHPQKNHLGFLKSAKLIQNNHPDVMFVFCGKGVSEENNLLVNEIKKYNLKNIFLLGPRDDIEKLNAGFDIAILNSISGEGFPNVLGEAMSCAVPCVATDVGDSRYIIGKSGIIVPPDNPIAMANACIELLNKGKEYRKNIGKKARTRILQYFSIEQIVKQYEQLYSNLVF